MFNRRNFISANGSSIKDVRKNDPFSPPPPSLCPGVSAFDQTPVRTSAFNIMHCTMVWQCNSWCCCFPHLPRPFDGLIYGSSKLHRPESKRCVGLSTSPYYTLWHKSYKMNNKLQFIGYLASPIESVCRTC